MSLFRKLKRHIIIGCCLHGAFRRIKKSENFETSSEISLFCGPETSDRVSYEHEQANIHLIIINISIFPLIFLSHSFHRAQNNHLQSAVSDYWLIIPFHLCCVSSSEAPLSLWEASPRFCSSTRCRHPDMSDFFFMDLLWRVGLQATAPLKPFVFLSSCSRTRGLFNSGHLPIFFARLFPASPPPSEYSESRRTRSSTCHPHEYTDPTLNLHEHFVQLFSGPAAWAGWASRSVSCLVSDWTPLLASVYRAALGSTGSGPPRTWRQRPGCRLLSQTEMCFQKAEPPYLLESLV